MLLLLLAFALLTPDAAWPTYGFDLANTRHTEINQIDVTNVSRLRVAWRYQDRAAGEMESSPVVVDGTLYVTTSEHDSVVALDAATGAKRWEYMPTLTPFSYCCAKANRGVAVADGSVFVATLDGRLLALNAATGELRWHAQVGDPRGGFSETMAPLVWNGLVFIGSSGGDFGIRGSFSAYDASSGHLRWRWWTTNPGWEGAYVTSVHGYPLHRDIAREKADAIRYRDAWRTGGGAVWMTPALDPKRRMIYLSTGNPAPVHNAATRPGDNLYTNSIVALDAEHGTMRWYYQETPHDVWDYDAASPPFLFDVRHADGRTRAAVGEAGKTGWLYVVDRDSGALVRISENLVPQREMYAVRSGGVAQPGVGGGAIGPASYDPRRHLAFVVAIDRPDELAPEPVDSRPMNRPWRAGRVTALSHSQNYICAIDIDTGKVKWRRHLSGGPGERFNLGFISGSLSAGGLVFVGEPNGVLFALDAGSGAVLWRYEIGRDDAPTVQNDLTFTQKLRAFARSIYVRLFDLPEGPPTYARIDGPPVSYVVNGKQYIALCADVFAGGVERNEVLAFALP